MNDETRKKATLIAVFGVMGAGAVAVAIALKKYQPKESNIFQAVRTPFTQSFQLGPAPPAPPRGAPLANVVTYAKNEIQSQLPTAMNIVINNINYNVEVDRWVVEASFAYAPGYMVRKNVFVVTTTVNDPAQAKDAVAKIITKQFPEAKETVIDAKFVSSIPGAAGPIYNWDVTASYLMPEVK